MTTFFDDLEQTLNDFRKDVKNGILQQVSNHNKNSNAHKSLFENKISKSSTTGLVKNDGSIDTSTYLTSHQTLPTIVDNLTTNDATQVLSAKQGKVLNDLIGDAITYINQ